MDTSTENTLIYFEAISVWMATHEGRMPGVEPAFDEPEGGTAVDTPYMDDVATHGISSWGGHPRVTKRIPKPNPLNPLPRVQRPDPQVLRQ